MLTRTFLRHTLLAVAVCAMLSFLTPKLRAAAGTAADDLAPFKVMANETLKLVTAGNMSAAAKKGQEIEAAWDAKSFSGQYPDIDDQMDTMNDALNSGNAKKATAEINKYLKMLDDASK